MGSPDVQPPSNPPKPSIVRSSRIGLFRLELLVERPQNLVAGQDLRDARVRLAAFADRREEFTVLKLEAVHRHVDLADVDLLVLAGVEVVVAGDVGRGVADIAEESAERAVIVERQRQGADRAVRRLELDAY